MIPKKIYTMWLNDKPGMPDLVEKCLATHYQILPDYEHEHITLENCDMSSKYVRDCIDAKRWVKASDFLRMHYLYMYGGIYLDADTEVLKSFDDLLDNKFFVCVEHSGTYANGIVGAEAGHPLLGMYLDRIENNFLGSGDLIFEPGIRAFTDLIFIANREQLGIKIYDTDYFFPYDHGTGEVKITENTHTFHHYMKSWIKK